MIENYKDRNKNTIFSKNNSLTMDTWESGINNNVVLVGSSGSGKTRRFVKPNLLQKNASYIISDPKGTLIKECGEVLSKKLDENDHEYTIKVLNLIDLTKSMHYNPFAYIKSEEDIHALVAFIIANNNDGKRVTKDSFWNEAASELLTALIGFVYYNMDEEEKNFNSVISLLDMARASEDMDRADDLDLLFEMQEKKLGDCFEVRFYKKYRTITGKTKSCVLATLASIVSPWELSAVKELVRYDELELDKIGDRYTALFVMISDTDDSKNFLAGILYSQIFQVLCHKADNNAGGRLDIHTRFFLDDFACVGKIPRFEKLIASIRSREISACIILQNESQLDSSYGEIAPNILGNCDTYLFMGSNDLDTCRNIAERAGKKVRDILQLPVHKCYVFSGQTISCDDKYALECHDRYSESGVFDYLQLLDNHTPAYQERVRETVSGFKMQDAMAIFRSNKEEQNIGAVDALGFGELEKEMSLLNESLSESLKEFDDEYLQGIETLMEDLPSREIGNRMRPSFFDSPEEDIFYHDLIEMIDKYHFSDIQVDIHVHLSEIFSNPMSTLERNKYKYRLVNQHCDFVIRNKYTLSIIAGIEIDGVQHYLDAEQVENDRYKDETFKNNGIPLLRIKASEARANHGWRNKVYQFLEKTRETPA